MNSSKQRAKTSLAVTNRWTRFDLIVIDEMAYVTIPESAAELLFQVIAGRAERASLIITTNLPFSEWTTMFPNARLCKAMMDRLTDQAHIIETGNESSPVSGEHLKKGKAAKNENQGMVPCSDGGRCWWKAKRGCGVGKKRPHIFLSENMKGPGAGTCYGPSPRKHP